MRTADFILIGFCVSRVDMNDHQVTFTYRIGLMYSTTVDTTLAMMTVFGLVLYWSRVRIMATVWINLVFKNVSPSTSSYPCALVS